MINFDCENLCFLKNSNNEMLYYCVNQNELEECKNCSSFLKSPKELFLKKGFILSCSSLAYTKKLFFVFEANGIKWADQTNATNNLDLSIKYHNNYDGVAYQFFPRSEGFRILNAENIRERKKVLEVTDTIIENFNGE